MKITQRHRLSRLFAIALVAPALLVPADAATVVVRGRARAVVATPRATIVVGKPRRVRRPVYVVGRPAATLDFNVKPSKTAIYVDGTYRGTCDDFDGWPQKMHLAPGRHRIRLVTPDGVRVERDVKLAAATEVDIDLDLR